jgi:hypothetical protein
MRMKKIAEANPTGQLLRISDAVNLGARNKVVRVSGRNFVFGGLAKFESKVGEFKEIAKGPEFPDPSLNEPVQEAMSRFGFNQEDFTQDWTVLPMARGTTLLYPTLDLCGFKYEPESGREIRRQVAVTKVGSPYSFLPSELVRYKDVAAAKADLNKLKKSYATCVANGGGQEGGVLTPYLFQPLPKSSAKLVDEGNRLVVLKIFGGGAGARQLLAFYQFNGQFFTGFYVVTGTENRLDESEISRWFDVASVLAERLVTQAQSVKN